MKVIFVIMLGLVQISCATIMNGTKQTIGFESEPPGATVSIAGNVIGQSPGSTELNRGSSYRLQFAKDGYDSSYVEVNSRFAHALEATIGNIWNVFLGLYVDVLSGGALELEPNHIRVILTKASDEKKR